MSRNKKLLYSSILLFFSLILLLIFLTTPDGHWSIIRMRDDFAAYESLFEDLNSHTHPVFEQQALGLMESRIAKSYRNDFIGTVVIAVNRDLVGDEIIGWNSLLSGNYQVCLKHKGRLSDFGFGAILLSMSRGLDHDENSLSNTLALLESLNSSNRLISSDYENSPVSILFDYEMAPYILAGDNFELVVPYEGTLSFNAGLLSLFDQPLPLVSSEALLSNGFRLTDGTGLPLIYGDLSRYDSVDEGIISDKDALLIANSAASFRRTVLRERLLSTASGIEHILSYVAYLVLLVIWSGLIFIRISDKDLKDKLFLLSSLLLFWVLVRMVKLVLPDGFLHRFLWYLYYIPLSFLPTMLFWIGQILARKDKDPWHVVIRRISLFFSAFLSIVVLTNDYHQLVFEFYMGLEGSNYDVYYNYGFLYYIIFARSLYLVIAFVLMASKHSFSKRFETFPLYGILVAAIIYFGAYALGIKPFRETDFTIVYGTVGLLFLEICMRSRMIPNNIRLREMLQSAPISMSIISNNLEFDFITDNSLDLPKDVVSKLIEISSEGSSPDRATYWNVNNILYSISKISGGFSVFSHDLQPIIKLRRKIEKQNEKILAQNNILTKTHKLQGEIALIKAKQELYAKIDSVLGEKIKHIENSYKILDPSDPTLFKIQLSKIKLLVNYCKRRGNLTILESSLDTCDPEDLLLWMNEALWELRPYGIEGIVTVSVEDDIQTGTASKIYDAYTEMLQVLMNYKSVALLASLTGFDDHFLMRFLMESDSIIDSSDLRLKSNTISSSFETNLSFPDEDGRYMIEIKILKEGW